MSLVFEKLKNLKLTQKIFISIVSIVVITNLVMSLAAYRVTYSMLEDNAVSSLKSAARQTSLRLDDFLRDVLRTAVSQSKNILLVEYVQAAQNQTLDDNMRNKMTVTLQSYRDVDQINIISYSVADSSGRILTGTDTNDIGEVVRDHDYFTVPLNSGLPYISQASYEGTPHFYASSPVRDNGRIIAILVIKYDLLALQEIVVQANGLGGESSFAVLLDENHIRLAQGINTELITHPISEEVSQSIKTNNNGVFFSHFPEIPDNTFGIAALVPLKEKSWEVLLVESQKAYLEPINNQIRVLIWVELGIIILVSFLSYLLSRLLANPIIVLTNTVKAISDGDFSKRARVSSLDEIGILSSIFNKTFDHIQSLIENLEETVKRRTRDLEIAAQVSKQITEVLHLDELLPKLVENTQQGFGLYFVSVYLYDEKKRQLTLSAGTGDAGAEMKIQGKLYDIEARPSLVAQAGREKRAVVIGNVSQSDTHFDNPLLPNTCSEAAIPMTAQGELVGVLDVQSEKEYDFSTENLNILTSLAEQIGLAVRNAQLYEEQIHIAEELLKADRTKSQFLASMSHELRTPMNAIINLVDMVASEMVGPVNEEQKTFLNQSLQSSRHLLHLINDVLDISKIQAGELTLYLESDVNIYEEINTVTKIIMPLINFPVQFHEDIDSDIPLITADRRRIRQVLLNLLSNAAKFTEQGSISLILKKRVDHLLFAVADTGPGISPSAQTIIFEPFIQTEDGRKKVEGTGLGLPISKNLIEAHGGKLWVESTPGEGSVFYFSLPIQKPNVHL